LDLTESDTQKGVPAQRMVCGVQMQKCNKPCATCGLDWPSPMPGSFMQGPWCAMVWCAEPDRQPDRGTHQWLPISHSVSGALCSSSIPRLSGLLASYPAVAQQSLWHETEWPTGCCLLLLLLLHCHTLQWGVSECANQPGWAFVPELWYQ